MGYYPLMLDVSRYPVILVGSGAEARFKLASLLEAKARLTVFLTEDDPALIQALVDHQIHWHQRLPTREDFAGARLVFAATQDRETNRRLAALARQTGAWVNVPDDLDFCDVAATSHFRRGPLLVSVFSSAKAPGVARAFIRTLESWIGDEWSVLIDQVSGLRSALRAENRPFVARRARLAEFVDAHLPSLFKMPNPAPGTVYLVGSGPGSIDFLTLGAFKVLRQADVVIYDRLVHPSVIDAANPTAKRIDVGKQPGDPAPSQADIHRQMITEARAQHRVVRLHGGDPMVYGRAGEEMAALTQADIPFVIMPGLSSALAAPALAQIPVTLRGVSDQVALVSAQTAVGSVNWEWLPHFHGTVVIMMGMLQLAQVVAALRTNGRLA